MTHSVAQRPVPAPNTVQIWSDLLCPFAYVAIHRLMAAREKAGLTEQVQIDHHCFPLELFNGPHPRPGTDSEAVGLGQIEPDAQFRLWTGPEWAYPSTVLLAAEAVLAAKEQSLNLSAELDLALRRGFWSSSRSIAHRQVILDIAAEVPGLDVAALTEALDTGRHRIDVMNDFAVSSGDEVKGSPHLFLADGWEANNPGISVHWQGPWAEGFPVVDSHDSDWIDEIFKRLGTQAGA
ncbi:MAG TPA: DsbA family protein [Jatrophihabitans sp.]|jgi:predicted DsbA family dithiol-disulfide isomerase|uniref:DsbA family oxidoreductase n=1 Tax=Jatrophihabitans sp. TaxID=1932789 RepID=UPI002F1785E5